MAVKTCPGLRSRFDTFGRNFSQLLELRNKQQKLKQYILNKERMTRLFRSEIQGHVFPVLLALMQYL